MRGHLESRIWEHDPTLYAPPKHRKACRYEAFVPDVITGFDEAIPAEVMGIVSDAEAAIAALNRRGHVALRPLARLLLRTESIASSKVEGLQADVRALARSEARADSGLAIGTTIAEVLGNIDAMEFAVETTAQKPRLAIADLTDIHTQLMERGPHPSIAGQLRSVQNWIGGNDHNPCGADFVPPPPEEVQRLLEDLIAAANDDALPPIVQAAIVHAQFETIHPFADGNGRTGRALIHVLLRRRGLAPSYVPPISLILAAQRDRYVAGLTQYRQGDTARWIALFATAAAQAAVLADGYLDDVAALQESWRQSLRDARNPRADAASWAVIDLLPGQAVITLALATALSGRSKSSTAAAIDDLVDAGILVPLTTSKRNRAFEAAGLLDLVAELETRA